MTTPTPDAARIERRRQRAGRAGFIAGALTAALAAGFNLWRAWGRLTLGATLILVLIALLNVPLFIGLGLLAERLSRAPSRPDGGR